jgi:hypothetical protein
MASDRLTSGRGFRRLLGGLLFIAGLLLFWMLWRGELGLVVSGIRGQGVVERIELSRRGERPLVRFTTRAGEERSFRGMEVSQLDCAKGDQVPLRYHEETPSLARIDSWQSLWRPLVIGFALSSALVIGGVFLVVWRRKGAKTPYPAARTRTRPRAGWGKKIALIALPLSFVAVGIASLIFLDSGQEAGSRTEKLDLALPEGRELIASFELPEEATPHDRPGEQVSSGREVWFKITQEYAAPGHFSKVRLHYYNQLLERGWRPYDQESWDGDGIEFCKAPWVVAIDSSVTYYENPDDRHHRYTVRLEWRLGWRRCQ